MTTRSPTIGPSRKRRGIYAAVIVIIVIGVLDLLIVNLNANPSKVSYSTSTSAVNPSSQLKLVLTVNTTNLGYGKKVSVTIDLINTQDRSLNISSAANWPLPNLTLSSGCGTVGMPYGIVLTRGYLTSSNLSLGTPLTVFPAGSPNANSTLSGASCPFHVPVVTYYVFNASSDFAERYYYLTGRHMNTSFTLNGIWSEDGNFHFFDPGVYSLICGDEWGDVVVLHLRVGS